MLCFPQVALKFFENRNNPAAFEPVPTGVEGSAKAPDAAAPSVSSGGPETYTVAVAGQTFVVSVTPGGEIAGYDAGRGCNAFNGLDAVNVGEFPRAACRQCV